MVEKLKFNFVWVNPQGSNSQNLKRKFLAPRTSGKCEDQITNGFRDR